jgi:hypothetical protein
MMFNTMGHAASPSKVSLLSKIPLKLLFFVARPGRLKEATAHLPVIRQGVDSVSEKQFAL